MLKERKKYGVFVASISILDKDFRVVASSESYEAGDTKQKKSLSHFVTDSSERNSFQKPGMRLTITVTRLVKYIINTG